MPVTPALPRTWEEYERTAAAYQAQLPLEHYMEATSQQKQRTITVDSFNLLKTMRSGFHIFGELLVQYPNGDELGMVVPDNMVILSDEPERARTSYPTALEQVPPFLVLEYVSASNQRKDYVENRRKYELELKVPYCLLFYPEKLDLRLYRMEAGRYIRMEPDVRGRMRVDELELELGLHKGWVRFWYRDQLLEIPEELGPRVHSLRDEVQQKDVQIQQKDAQIQQKERQLEDQLASLRSLVERRARKASRQDVIASLSNASWQQLSQWLEALEDA